jgi:uncharacterized protein (TIGR03066 family)
MKSLCAAALAVAVLALAGHAKAADDAAKLVGKWEVTKSGGDTPVGAVVDFQKDGKMAAAVNLDGKDVKLTGTYKFDGKKLKVDLKLGEDKIEHEFDVKFKGADEMTLTDGEKTDTLKRLKKK